MFQSLRARLWLTYAAVIFVMLSLFAILFFVVSFSSTQRSLPTLQRLVDLSITTNHQLASRASEGSMTFEEMLAFLDETADTLNTANFNTHLALATAPTFLVAKPQGDIGILHSQNQTAQTLAALRHKSQ